MDAFLIDFSLSLNQTQIVITLMAFLLGGFSKGLIGFGMPLTCPNWALWLIGRT